MDQLQMIKGHGSKEQVSRLKQLLLSQKNELKRLEKLVNIAKPAEMPKLQPKTISQKNTVMIGKRWGFGGAKNLRKIEVKTSHNNEEIFENNKNKSEEKSENTQSNVEMTQQPENEVQNQELKKSISKKDSTDISNINVKPSENVEKSKIPQNEPAKKVEKSSPGPQLPPRKLKFQKSPFLWDGKRIL